MSDSDLKLSFETIETTIGELIEAITEVALESGSSEKESYQLASITLEDILRRNEKDLELPLH